MPTCGRCSAQGLVCITADALKKRGPPSKEELRLFAAQGLHFVSVRKRLRNKSASRAPESQVHTFEEARQTKKHDCVSLLRPQDRSNRQPQKCAHCRHYANAAAIEIAPVYVTDRPWQGQRGSTDERSARKAGYLGALDVATAANACNSGTPIRNL